MEIEKAIEIKEALSEGRYVWTRQEAREADQLSIEALKRCQRLRSDKHCSPIKPLPGETKEVK